MPPSLELLESRIAPASLIDVAYDAATGALQLSAADDDPHHIAIYSTGAKSFRLDGLDGTQIGTSGTFFLDLPKLTSISFVGGAADDIVDVTRVKVSTINLAGGAGVDTFNLRDVTTSGTLQLDLGADGGEATLDGEQVKIGGDLAVNYSGGGDVFLAALSNVVKGAVNLTGGDGNDGFRFGGNRAVVGKGVTFTGGANSDALGLDSGLSVTIGKGPDGRSIVFTGGDGDDLLQGFTILGKFAGGVTFQGGDGFNRMSLQCDVADVGGDLVVTGGVDDDELDGSPALLKVKGSVSLELGEGSNVVDLFDGVVKIGRDVSVITGAGDEDGDFAGRDLDVKGKFTVDFGDGFNVLDFGSARTRIGGALSLTVGADDDDLLFGAVSLVVGGAATIDLGDGVNQFGGFSNVASFGKDLTFRAGAGDETINLRASTLSVKGALTIEPGDGTNFVSILVAATKVGGAFAYTGGVDSDFIQAESSTFTVGGAATIQTADGPAIIGLLVEDFAAAALDVSGGVDNDDVTVLGTRFALKNSLVTGLSAGVDDFRFEVQRAAIKGGVSVSSGPDADTVTFVAAGTVGSDLLVDLGSADDDRQDLNLGGRSGIVGGLRIGGALNITSAATDTGALGLNDAVTLRDLIVGKAVSINLGVVASLVTIDNLTALGDFTLNTGDGADDVKIETGPLFGPSTFSKLATISLGNDADNLLIGISSAAGSPSFVRFLGNATIDGGAGVNTANLFDSPTVNFLAAGVTVTRTNF